MNETTKRRIGFGIVLAGLAGVAILIFRELPDHDTVGPAAREAADSRAKSGGVEAGARPDEAANPNRGVPSPRKAEVVIHDIARTSLDLHQSEDDPEEDLRIIQSLIGFYRRVYGANPEGGLNFEIVEKLTGGNERKLAMLVPDHPSLNADGELVDRWGTPYWFHPVSRDLMEIVSAGPDKELWTQDDVILE